MSNTYGLCYQGSKGKIAIQLIKHFPSADNFYDLFGGGGSITHAMLENRKDDFKYFHYNDIIAPIGELLKKTIYGEYNYNKFIPDWISREDFFKLKDIDAYVGLCWSFGNANRTYLFSKEIELYKKSMHIAVVFGVFDELAKEVLGFELWNNGLDTITKRRLFLRQKIENYQIIGIPKILLPFLNEKQKKQLAANELNNICSLQQLEHLERLERIQKLERLQQLERLDFTASDYRSVKIKKNSIVYCDIPYLGTTGYGEFNHNVFLDWAATRNFPVYVSEYNINDSRFHLVTEIKKRCTMSSINNNSCIEKLYVNEAGKIKHVSFPKENI